MSRDVAPDLPAPAVPAIGAHLPPGPTPGRCAATLLARTRAALRPGEDLWVFGYASLIWRPEFQAVEERTARAHGWHRALEMVSRLNRGTPECPGLVCALLPGGCVTGMVYRVPAERAHDELTRLWEREMPNAVYDPRWLPCRTEHGPVRALGFTLSRRSPHWTGRLDDQRLLSVLRHARGRFGTTLDYLLQTERGLRERGIVDGEFARMAALARHHGLAA